MQEHVGAILMLRNRIPPMYNVATLEEYSITGLGIRVLPCFFGGPLLVGLALLLVSDKFDPVCIPNRAVFICRVHINVEGCSEFTLQAVSMRGKDSPSDITPKICISGFGGLVSNPGDNSVELGLQEVQYIV